MQMLKFRDTLTYVKKSFIAQCHTYFDNGGGITKIVYFPVVGITIFTLRAGEILLHIRPYSSLISYVLIPPSSCIYQFVAQSVDIFLT